MEWGWGNAGLGWRFLLGKFGGVGVYGGVFTAK